jgi:hypothetical protein
MASEIKVDTISENTSANGVTIDGVNIKDGTITGANLGRKNYIINGNFDIWQRGTSLGSGAGYTADRWRNNLNGGTIARDQGSFTVGQTDVPNNPEFYYDFDRTVANTGVNLFLEQRIEDVKTLSSETVTVSFWAKYTTNAPTSLNIRFVQNFGSGGSTAVGTDLTTTQTITSSWVKYTLTGTIPSISGKTVGSGNYVALQFQNQNLEVFDIQIAQVQVEKGSVATDFEVRHIGEEYQNCLRYYNRYVADDTVYCLVAQGTYNTSTQILVLVNHPVKMRTAPTMSYSQLSDFDIEPFDVAPTAITYGYNSHLNTQLSVTDPTSRTTGFCGQLTIDVANGYLELDAEL